MLNDDFNAKIDRFTRGIVRRKVKQLIGRAGFTKQDREDLEHDLFVRVLQSLQSFDPDRAHRYKFITAVVERHVANLLRNKQAEKRDHRRVTSLNVMIEIEDEGPTELGETIDQREFDLRLGRDQQSAREIADRAMDIADVIATLPKAWQTFIELRQTLTMTEVADKMGVPRTTLNGWTGRIRQRFEDAGLENYL